MQVNQSKELAAVSIEKLAAPETGDGVAGLAGRALVAAVGGRVMGWRVFDINDMRDDEWRADPANYPYLEQYVGTALYTSETERRLWNPDTNIAVAMEVVERMALAGYEFDCGHTKSGGAGLFAVARFGLTRDFENSPWQSEEWGEGEGWKRTYSEAQALAICRAALQATASAAAQQLEPDANRSSVSPNKSSAPQQKVDIEDNQG